jgi:hypothetical protein
VSLYPSKINVFRKITGSVDATGHPVESQDDLHVGISASVQLNPSTRGANANHHESRGTLEQPGTLRIYTQTNVSNVKPDDIIVHIESGQKYQVLRAVDQGNRGRRWRIEASIL